MGGEFDYEDYIDSVNDLCSQYQDLVLKYREDTLDMVINVPSFNIFDKGK